MFTGHDTQVLGVAECRRLLATELIGRVAYSQGALPAVLPVVYRLVGDRVVFGVEREALRAALSDTVVAFEVDHVDLGSSEGWTVMVIGRSHPVNDGIAALVAGQVRPVPGRRRLIGVSLDRLSGLRAGPPAAGPGFGRALFRSSP